MRFAELALPFLGAAVVSGLLTVFVRSLALRFDVVDTPNHRSSHTQVTPRGGGLAIAVTFAGGVAWIASRVGGTEAVALCVVLFSSLVVAAVGLIDDRRALSVEVRLLSQLLAVGVGLAVALPAAWQAGAAGLLVGGLALVLACTWFVNLFNFMDGIDGLAAAEAVFVALAAAGLLVLLDAPAHLALAWIVLAGASSGFLMHNRPPARIFMGDAGSGFLGFTIAILLVQSCAVPGFSPWTGLILVGVFVADATVTLLRRVARGVRWAEPHRSHAYQRLARRWRSHGRVTGACVALNCGLSLPLALVSVLQPESGPVLALGFIGALGLLAWLLGAGSAE